MSKFFYKGSRVNMQDTRGTGYNPKKVERVGTEQLPAEINVQSEERKAELLALAEQHDIVLKVEVNEEQAEDTRQLDALLNTGKTLVKEKTPARNEPCLCGSGKKYKKCCGAN